MSEIILYITEDGLTKINVQLGNELSESDTMRKIGISDFSTKLNGQTIKV